MALHLGFDLTQQYFSWPKTDLLAPRTKWAFFDMFVIALHNFVPFLLILSASILGNNTNQGWLSWTSWYIRPISLLGGVQISNAPLSMRRQYLCFCRRLSADAPIKNNHIFLEKFVREPCTDRLHSFRNWNNEQLVMLLLSLASCVLLAIVDGIPWTHLRLFTEGRQFEKTLQTLCFNHSG